MKKFITEAHLLKLEEDIARLIDDPHPDEQGAQVANRILMLPLLRDLLVQHMVDLPQERVGYLIGLIGK